MVKSQYATTGIILKTKPVIKQMKSSVPVPQRELLLNGLQLLVFTISEIKIETFENIY